MKADPPATIAAFAQAAGVSPRQVRRLRRDGLPLGDGLRAAKAWLAAARRARNEDPGLQAQIGLLRAQEASVQKREARLRSGWAHDSEWTPAWRDDRAQVGAVLEGWRQRAPQLILAVLRPDGLRVFPGNDPRAIGFALQAHVAYPLLEAIAAGAGDPPAPPAAKPRRRLATKDSVASVADAKRRLIARRASELDLRVAVRSDAGWRLRAEVVSECLEAVAKARQAILGELPGAVLRLGTSASEARIALVVEQICAAVAEALEAPLARPGRRP
jgi:hypothetical protein